MLSVNTALMNIITRLAHRAAWNNSLLGCVWVFKDLEVGDEPVQLIEVIALARAIHLQLLVHLQKTGAPYVQQVACEVKPDLVHVGECL